MRAGLPGLIDPAALPWHLLPALLPASVAIAVACFAEAAAIGRRFAEDDGESWSCNRELISQGVCNLVVAAFGGFPVAGSLSRSSLARTAGGTTQLAHVVTGLTVLAFLPLGATLLSALPRACLGGLVAVAVAPLLAPAGSLLVTSRVWRSLVITRRLRRKAASSYPLRDLALGWGTAAATMAASPRLELGLQAGLGLAGALAAWQLAGRRMQDMRAAAAASAAL